MRDGAMKYQAELQFSETPEEPATLNGEIKAFMTEVSALMAKHKVAFLRVWEHSGEGPGAAGPDGDAPKSN